MMTLLNRHATGATTSLKFLDDQDRQKFSERLGKNIIEAKCSVYAWVLIRRV